MNTIIHSTVLKCFGGQSAKRIFAVHAEMSHSGAACDTIIYNTNIDACASCGGMDRAPASWRS